MIMDMYNLYILVIVVVVFDDLIIIDEIEIDRILIKSNIYGWSGNGDWFSFICMFFKMFDLIVCV